MRFRVRSIVTFTLACALFSTAPLFQTQLCRAESARHEAKRVHKVEKKLVKYPPGTYLRLVFTDHSQSVGTADRFKADSFRFTEADDNSTHIYAYAEVAHVAKTRTYVGEGLRRHRPRFLTVAIAGAAAAGAAFALVQTQ